jgi:hypothetical protein
MDGKSSARRTVVRRNLPFVFPLILVAGFGVIVVMAIVIGATAPLSPPRIPMNHMRAAHSAVQLIAAERQYALRFPAAGFTCDLRQLGQAGIVDKVLASGEKAGYRYELHGCQATAAMTAFSLTVVPIAQGTTGEFAFCANHEGILWYAAQGSGDECFRARVKWPRSDLYW